MTNRILVVLCLVAAGTTSAQPVPTEVPEINSLRAPTGPALTVLDIGNTAVERPTTPGAVGIALMSATNDFTEIPRNYALEIAPYWLTSHESRQWQHDKNRTILDSLARTFSFSVATAEAGEDSTRLAIGIRASLLSGTFSKSFETKMQDLHNGLAGISQQITDLTLALNRPPTNAEIAEIVAMHQGKLAKVDYQRVGWFWDVALAGSADFPDNRVELKTNEGWAAWTTLSREWDVVALLGVARYRDDPRLSDGTVLDLGGRIVWNAPRFGASLEVVRREIDDRPSQTRTVGLLEYAVRNDAWLSFSFGEDFDDGGQESLIARLGLNIAFDRSRRLR